VLTLCYASYFFLPVILAASLYSRRRDFDRVVVTLAFAFSLNFLFYLALPALGPNRVADFARPQAFDGYFFAARVQGLLSHMEGQTPDAFPSGHTLITLLVLALAWQMQRRLFWIFLPIGSGLIVATIYLRYHYLADFAFSIVLAPLCLRAGEQLANHWRKS
jgi:membrane-associated phospholipid phosphatase